MKIRLAILDKDTVYLTRITSVFTARYAEKLEVHSFTDKDVALQSLKTSKIDIFLVSTDFSIPTENLPRRCVLVYFVDSPQIDTVKEQKAICKYQKASLIYKQLLSIYAESSAAEITGIRLQRDANAAQIIVFSSASGGTGSSTVAAACARKAALYGKKVLYINFEKLGNADLFFQGEGQFDLGDLIYALKSNKANLPLKIESTVKKDKTGVYFFSSCKIALDMLEMTGEEKKCLLSELELTGGYQYIIVDADFSLDDEFLMLVQQSVKTVLVSDGSEIANGKLSKCCQALSILEQQRDLSFMNRMGVFYNKFSNKTGKVVQGLDLREYGGVQRFEHAGTEQIIRQLVQTKVLDKILD